MTRRVTAALASVIAAGALVAVPAAPSAAAVSTTFHRSSGDLTSGTISVACTNPGAVHRVGVFGSYTCPTASIWVRTACGRNTKQRNGVGFYFTWARATGWKEDDNGGWFEMVSDGTSCRATAGAGVAATVTLARFHSWAVKPAGGAA